MRRRSPLSAALALAAFVGQEGHARAGDAEITSDTAAQFYEMRSPTGEQVIARRRLTTTLGASVYDLIDTADDPKAPTLSFRVRLRYDADYGGLADETNVTNFGRLVPGFQRGPVDLMYGYLEGRRFLHGWLGFRLGRQYTTDALGWWSFDGGLVKLTSPYFVGAEFFGGLEQRGGMPLSLPRWERDGVWRGDRGDYDPNAWRSFQENDVAPAYGAALETTGIDWLHARLSYRRVLNTYQASTSPFGSAAPVGYGDTRISQERLGYAMDATLGTAAAFKGGFAYDFYAGKMATIYASVDGFIGSKVTVSADYDYYVPTFDGDSIWNFFLAMPMNDVGLRATWDASERLSLSAGVRGRLFQVATGPEDTEYPSSPNGLATQNQYPSSSVSPMGGGNVSARYRWSQGQFGARGAVDVADSGDRLGMDLYGERTLQQRYVLQGRAGVWHWKDDLRPDRDAVSLQTVFGAGYKILPRSLAMAEFEHDMNRIAGQRFRVMLWLSVALAK